MVTETHKWDSERFKRELASRDGLLNPADRTKHRICPICEGDYEVQVFAGTYYDQPEYGECPNCEGIGRVDQEGWERGQMWLRDRRDYEKYGADEPW